jgi:hypothetical protein
LERRFQRMNPVQLLAQIRKLQSDLWELAHSSSSQPTGEKPEEEVDSPIADAEASKHK